MSNVFRITALAALLLTPALAQAQDVVGSWPGLKVAALETVYVTERDGRQTEGRLVGFAPDSVIVFVDGAEQRFARERVTRIERRGDSLRNGALIGAGLGVTFGLLAALGSDCPEDFGGSCPGVRATYFALSTVAYTGLGAGIDGLIVRRTRVFEAGPPGVAARITPNGARLSVGFSW
jgi:hypothetical protein